MEIAIFGGTFDPPTNSHEAIIRACLDKPEFDEVWVMPSGERLDKVGVEGDEARLCMLGVLKQAAFGDDQRLVVSDFEQHLTRPTETSLTLEALEQLYPTNRFWFVYGADSYHHMPTWKNGEALRQRLNMLLVAREGYDLPDEDEHIRHLRVPRDILDQAISSTKVREALRENQSVDAFVHCAVVNWIRDHQAYHAMPTELSS